MWQLARVYLRRILGRPGLLFFLFCLPIALCALEYAVFSAPHGLAQVPLVVVDDDGSAASKRLVSCLTYGVGGDDLLVTQAKGWDQAWAMYEAGGVAAVVSIPAGYAKAIGAARSPHAGWLGTDDAPGNMAARAGLSACIRREQGGTGVSRLGEPALVAVVRSGPLATTREAIASFVGSHFPGLVVFALLFAAQTLAAPLFRDRQAGVEQRLETNNAGAGTRLFAALCYLTLGLTAFACVLLIPSGILFGHTLATLPGMALAALGMAAIAALLQMIVLAMAPTPRAAVAVSSMLALLLALAGGSFLPLSLYPSSVRASLSWLPNAAAQNVITGALDGTSFSIRAVMPLLVWLLFLAAAVAVLGAGRKKRSL